MVQVCYYTNIYIKHTLYYCYQAVTRVLIQYTGNLSLDRGIGSHSSIIVSDRIDLQSLKNRIYLALKAKWNKPLLKIPPKFKGFLLGVIIN